MRIIHLNAFTQKFEMFGIKTSITKYYKLYMQVGAITHVTAVDCVVQKAI